MMSKEGDDVKLVPRLRFPEFLNSEAWEQKPLGKIAGIITGNTPKTSKKEYYNGDKMFVSPTDISDGRHVIQTKTTLTDLGFSKSRSIKKNSILFVCIGSTIGKIAQNKSECATNQQINSLVPFEGNSADFLYSALEYHSSWIARLAGKQAIPIINKSVFSSISIDVPSSLQEQQKIADCLSSLDTVIAAENERLTALQTHKKGLLQQLFPAEGEAVPRLRFSEFEGDWDWKMKPFGGLFSFKISNSFSRDKLNYIEGSVKNIHYGDIHTKFSTLFDIRKEDVPNVNLNISIDRINRDHYCLEGDIIIADASEDLEDIGKSIEIVNLDDEKLLAGLHTFLARQIKFELITGFGGYLFKSTRIRNQIKRESQGTKILGISKGRISNIKILYPENKKEQQKIANCLSSLDSLISVKTEKIYVLKAHKKGLMQQLFPNLKEQAK